MPARRRQVLALAGPVLALMLLAGGCGGDDEPRSRPAESASTSQPGDPDVPVPAPDLPTAPTVDNGAGAAADVSWQGCPTEAGHQSIDGTVTNPTKRTLSYVVEISWTNDSAQVLGRGFAVVRDLAPGASTDWQLDAQVVSGATRCVPYVLRGDRVAD